jgi:hypothetical protein
MERWVGLVAAAALTLAQAWGAGGGAAAGEPPRAAAASIDRADALPSPVVHLRARLEALRPTDPRAYYLLGEEVAAELPACTGEGEEEAARRLARQLYGLAFELDRGAAGRGARAEAAADEPLASAACIALAAVSPAEGEKRWLWALARSIDPRIAGPAWAPIRLRPAPDSLALDVCAVLGYARDGEGRRAEQVLERPGVKELLERYEAMLSPAGTSGGADSIRRMIREWPACPECRNRRVVTRPGPGGNQTVLCRTCNGVPGPALTSDELILQLRLESALLSGIQRSWAAQTVVDRGSPLRDVDPADLAPVIGVDPSRPIWREGRWVAEGAAEGEGAAVDSPADTPGTTSR